MDNIRHEEVRDPMQVHLGRHPPGGGLVLFFLHQDLPFRGSGQLRSVVGELVTWPRAVVRGVRPLSFVTPSPGTGPGAAWAAEGSAETLPGPRADPPGPPRPWRSARAGEIANCNLQ